MTEPLESQPESEKTAPPAPRKRRLRWALRIGIALLVLVIAAVVVLRTWFHGEALADRVEGFINQRIRGHVEIDSIEWNLWDLDVAVTGGWLPIEVHGLTVYDDMDREVLHTDHATGKIDAHAAMFGMHDFIFKDVKLPEGGRALIRQVAEPYPVHEYDYITVSLVSAFYPKNYPSIYAGYSPRPKRIYEVRNFKGSDIDLVIEWEEALRAEIHGIEAEGSITASGKLPMSPKMYFSVTGQAAEADICFGPGQLTPANCPPARRMVLHDLDITELEQLPRHWPDDMVANDFNWRATARTSEGAAVTINGAKMGYWTDYFGGDYLAEVVLNRAGGVAARLSDGLATGDELYVRAGVSGPAMAPVVDLTIEDLDLHLDIQEGKQPLDVHIPRASAAFDLATYSGDIEQTSAQAAGGEMGLAATFSLEPFQFDLHVGISKPIQVAEYLPRDVRQLAGTTLAGGFSASGNETSQRIDIRDLHLGRAHLDGTLYREGGVDLDNPEQMERKVHARNLVVALGRDTVTANGEIDFRKEKFDFDLRYQALDAPRYLRHFGVPVVAQRVAGGAKVWGSFADPRAHTEMVASGVPVVDQVDARLDYRRQLLTIESASTTSLGGSVRATGKVALGGTPRIVDLQATAENVQVSKLPGVGAVASGRLDARISGSGTIDRFEGKGTADVTGLDIAGDKYPRMHVDASTTPEGVQTVQVDVARAKGGELTATLLHDRRRNLSGNVSLRDLPVETFGFLAPLGPEQSPVGGTVDAELSLGGTWTAPLAEGTVSLARSWVGQAFLGNGELRVDESGPDKIRISGELFQGKLSVVGTLGTQAPYSADLKLDVRRLEIDHFLPDQAEAYGVRGWITGQIELHTALAPTGKDRPSGSLRLTEVVLYLESEDPQGRPAHITLRNKNELAINWDGTRAVLAHPALFAGPAGDIEITGSGSEKALAMHVKGDMAVKLIAPYMREYFDSMSGNLAMAVDVTGSMDKPIIQGTVEFDKVAVRPTGQDATVSISTGRVTITNNQVAITDLTVLMVDQYSDERAELKVRGGIGMQNFRPTMWALELEGQLGGKMLLAFAPNVFSSASGMAYLSVRAQGPGEVPADIDGTLWFKCPRRRTSDPVEREGYTLVGKRCKIDRPLALQLRGGGGHEVALHDGRVRFAPDEDSSDSHLLYLEKIAGWIDDEGRIELLDGEARIRNWQPEDFDVRLTATGLPLRVPQTLDVTANVRGLNVVGTIPTEELSIAGKVEIVDGAYMRKFNFWTETLLPQRTTVESTPLWETNRMLGRAELDLQVDVRTFYVRNNLASIQMSGKLQLSNTPRDPRLDGQIEVNQGSFKSQGMRVKFERTRGTVTFSRHERFPADTPTLHIHSEADYRDSSGQDDIIHLAVDGTLDNLTWDLYSERGLNKQAAFPIVFLVGRTSEELRRQAGDAGVGSDPTRLQDQGAVGNVYDELVKDLAADFLSLIIEDRITRVTKLDVARIEIGTSSVGVHAEKELSRNFKFLGDLEKRMRAWHMQGGAQLRVNDDISIELEGNRTDFDSETEEDRAEVRLRGVWRKSYP